MSSATTQGIRISVETRFMPERSGTGRWAFAYTVRIENVGDEPAQLRSRHWVITDGNGSVREVRGPGVVGEEPLLEPGEAFEYTSGAELQTPHGSMRGSYQMERPDGRAFDARIPSFALVQPGGLN